ncbi:hypothetical protein V1506DRAFT_543958 [Lipomyces tetrasporus]
MLQGIRSRAIVLKKMEGNVVDLERRTRSELLDVQNFFSSHYWSVDEATGDAPRWVSEMEYELRMFLRWLQSIR